MTPPTNVQQVRDQGHALARNVLGQADREALLKSLGPADGAGRRGMLQLPCVTQLATSPAMLNLAAAHLRQQPVPVRTIYFDKSPQTNWLVSWHQDLTIALAAKCDVAGYGPWSVKAGVPHAQAPAEALQEMITLRLHLDDTDASNGALKVLPGSHQHGILSSQDIHNWQAHHLPAVCEAAAGDVMLMRPLLLHASSKSQADRHRRILHIEYAGFTLPQGLQWHENA